MLEPPDLHCDDAPEKFLRQVLASQWSFVVPHHPYWEQHSEAEHLAFLFSGPQFPAKTVETREKRARVAKRILYYD